MGKVGLVDLPGKRNEKKKKEGTIQGYAYL